MPGATRAVTAALHGVRRTMRAAGYERSDYRLVAMGYASPFPEGRWFRYPEDGWSRLTEGGCPVWDADADWAADRATVDLAGMLRDAATATGAEYLDLADAFDGHQLCDRRARTSRRRQARPRSRPSGSAASRSAKARPANPSTRTPTANK